jgi:hypothetical protein
VLVLRSEAGWSIESTPATELSCDEPTRGKRGRWRHVVESRFEAERWRFEDRAGEEEIYLQGERTGTR